MKEGEGMLDKTPYDQFQRYETIRRLIQTISIKKGFKKVRVLEIGANEHRNLEKFLPQYQVFYSDLKIPESLKGCAQYFAADATNMPQIETDSFDFVVALDVFEHIPQNQRKDFIKEISRVSRYGAIFCFPFDSLHVKNAERRANEYYKAISGTDYIWLEEHVVNGLPSQKEVKETLNRLNEKYVSFEHGTIELWEELIKAHFYATFIPEIIEYRFEIDLFYNQNIYQSDRGNENYRTFFIISNDEQVLEAARNVGGNFEQNMNKDKKTFIAKSIKELKELAMLRMKREIDVTESTALNQMSARVFYDCGEGFSEENSSCFSYDSEHISIALNLSIGTKTLRFDPVEGKGCILSNLSCITDQGDVSPLSSNGKLEFDSYFFKTEDPQLIFKPQENTTWVKITADIFLIEDRFFWKTLDTIEERSKSLEMKISKKSASLYFLEEEKKSLQEEYSVMKNHLLAQQNRIHELDGDLALANANYQNVISSTSYKITKPLRWFLDKIKWLGKSVPGVRLIYKGLFSLKYFGIKGTARKTLNKMKGISGPFEDKSLLRENTVCRIVEEKIKFSIIVPLYKTPEIHLRKMIDSVLEQTYGNWELCLGDGSEDDETVEEICKKYADRDKRIIYVKLPANMGISENSNAALRMATGEYVALLDHDDMLTPNALMENAYVIEQINPDVIYSDEDHICDIENGKKERHIYPFYKPDWSPDLLKSQMYICHLLVIKKVLVDQVGGFRQEFDGSQDYDLMLRLSEITQNIYHIPEILYSWRLAETSTSVDAENKPYAHNAGLDALNDHLKRTGKAKAFKQKYPFTFDVRYETLTEKPLISVIIPMKDQKNLTQKCLDSIFEQTTYSNYEVLLLNNRSEKADTKKWLDEVSKKYRSLRVLEADFEFNWSKLNNFGIRHAKGEVYIFLNNDTVVISADWMERLAENALRPDIGVVGSLLLYEDNTIQHAGVVVGMGGWADHVFKGMDAKHGHCPFVSPLMTRNVLAVTGACMAISKNTVAEIGLFDERFVICGSDVEICIRAYESGKSNLYCAQSQLYHLESKSRDNFIPEVDFTMSARCYDPYRRDNIDPFYNPNLDIMKSQPSINPGGVMTFQEFKNHMSRVPLAKTVYHNLRKKVNHITFNPSIAEVMPIKGREAMESGQGARLNLLIPSLNKEHVFGGISTALMVYLALVEKMNVRSRIIITDAKLADNLKDVVIPSGYVVTSSEKENPNNCHVVEMSDRSEATLSIEKNDIFMATAWWTAYNIYETLEWQANRYQQQIRTLIYLIQDYEPGFYPWSSRYQLAESTYTTEIPQLAVFNSKQLSHFFELEKYSFTESCYFKPVLNSELKEILILLKNPKVKKKQVIIYGRPSTARNAFEVIVSALKKWCSIEKNIGEWEILSMGEEHPEIDLGCGKKMKSMGKMSLKEYGELMLESYMGISLMVSPHPSYPPLEMSTFGVKTITNTYKSKDLSSFNANIISLQHCSPNEIALNLAKLSDEFTTQATYYLDSPYVNGDMGYKEVCVFISEYYNREGVQ